MLKMLSGLLARMIGRKPQLPNEMMWLRGMDQWRCDGFTMATAFGVPPTITIKLVADNAITNGAEWVVGKDCAWMRKIAEIGGNHLHPQRITTSADDLRESPMGSYGGTTGKRTCRGVA